MDLIDLEDESIDAEVMDSLAVTMDDFRVKFIFNYELHIFPPLPKCNFVRIHILFTVPFCLRYLVHVHVYTFC